MRFMGGGGLARNGGVQSCAFIFDFQKLILSKIIAKKQKKTDVSIIIAYDFFYSLVLVRKFLDKDVLKAVLNGRFEDGVGTNGSKASSENFR